MYRFYSVSTLSFRPFLRNPLIHSFNLLVRSVCTPCKFFRFFLLKRTTTTTTEMFHQHCWLFDLNAVIMIPFSVGYSTILINFGCSHVMKTRLRKEIFKWIGMKCEVFSLTIINLGSFVWNTRFFFFFLICHVLVVSFHRIQWDSRALLMFVMCLWLDLFSVSFLFRLSLVRGIVIVDESVLSVQLWLVTNRTS